MPVCPMDSALINSSGTTSDLTPILAAVCLGTLSNPIRARAQGALDIVLYFSCSISYEQVYTRTQSTSLLLTW